MPLEDLRQISWQCVHFVDADELAEPLAEAQRSGATIRRLNAADMRTRRDFFAALQSQLPLPSYFGHNWDALDECLRDLPQLTAPKTPFIFVIEQSTELWTRRRDLVAGLIEVWLSAAETWSRSATPFHLVWVW